MLKVNEAIQCITSELKKDADLRNAYKANIAMAFYDEFMRTAGDKEVFDKNAIAKIANQAADNFLTLWCK